MRSLRYAVALLFLFCMAGTSLADFDGPAPLAWRWLNPTEVVPKEPPLVVDGTVYVPAGQRIMALDAESGNFKWQFPRVEPINGYFRTSPVMADGFLVAAGDNKTIYGIDTEYGLQKWLYLTQNGVIGNPVAVGKVVVFATSDNYLHAIDAENGTPVWEEPLKFEGGIRGDLAAHGTNVLVLTNTSELHAINVSTQKPSWIGRFTAIPPNISPVVFGDLIYMNSGQYVVAMSAFNGRLRWQQNVGETIRYNPVVSPAGVAVGTQQAHVFVFRPNGARVNQVPIDLDSIIATSPSSAGDYFVFPCSNGALTMLDPRNTEVVWSYLIRPIGVEATLETFNNIRTRNTRDNELFAIPAASAPVTYKDTLLVRAIDGSLLAFDKNLGVDLTAPQVDMLYPNPGDQISGQPPLDFIFRVGDGASGVNPSTIKFELGGKEMEYEYRSEGLLTARVSALNQSRPLPNGRLELKVTLGDWLGNTTSKVFALSIDNSLPPAVRPKTTPNRNQRGNTGRTGRGRR